MKWTMVSRELDSAQLLREDIEYPLTSPRYDDLDERAQLQVRAAYKTMRGLVKAQVVGEGKIRLGASGQAHHEPDKMPVGEQDFIAIHIGRVN